jgi:carotenoid cleavage dioxygenase-like enzyme
MAATAATTAPAYAQGLMTLDHETEVDALPIEGALPRWLAGSLLRTGPAKFEAGERSVRHWFDGLAMLHRYTFEEGRVSYANRFLHSRAWRAVEETGELRYSEFATDPCRSLFRRVASMFRPALTDNGAVNVSRVGDEFIAMTETPLPVVFDPETLEAAGVAYEPPGMLTTAHPHNDPDRGELLNFAARLGPRSSYRFYAQRSRDDQRVVGSFPVRHPGYVHSFGLTERYLVLAEGPFVVDPIRLATSGRPYIENYRWEPERGARFLVMERDGGAVRGVYETDAFFTFHHINAFERDGELVVDLCAYDDPSIIDALYLDRMRAGEPIPPARPRRYTIGLDSGAVRWESLADTDLELPRIHYRRHNGRPYRYAYGGAVSDTFLGRIVKVDIERGHSESWGEDGCFAGEPVFVPEPGAEAEDAGVLLSVVLDSRAESSFLLVLDAATLEERARAEVPHRIPLSFHGQFFGA